MNLTEIRRMGKAPYEKLHLPTYPVAITHILQALCYDYTFPRAKTFAKKYRLRKESGVVVQHTDDTLAVMSPKNAARFITEMPHEGQRLY